MDKCLEIMQRSRVCVGDAGTLLPELLPKGRTIVISDSNIDRCCHGLLSSYEHILIGIGEQAKTLITAERLYRTLIDMEADRSCFLLGIGGGVVTDVTGFVASTYMRGLNFGFVPTTLLAQVDAAIGGKNGVNIGGYKNITGTFTQPCFTVCDVALLATLPDREFRAGLAEVVKTAIIGDAALFGRLEEVSFDELRHNQTLLKEVVEAALRVKVAIVNADERESGVRRVLNLGHTLAHAVEKSVRGVNHGEAVAMGLYRMAEVATQTGMLGREDADRIKRLLERFGLPTVLPADMRILLKAILKDKKRDGDTLHLILPAAVGDVRDCLLTIDEVSSLLLQPVCATTSCDGNK